MTQLPKEYAPAPRWKRTTDGYALPSADGETQAEVWRPCKRPEYPWWMAKVKIASGWEYTEYRSADAAKRAAEKLLRAERMRK